MRKTIGLTLVPIAAALAFFWHASRRSAETDAPVAPAAREASTSPARPEPPSIPVTPAISPDGEDGTGDSTVLPPLAAAGASSYPVDLEGLRARLPNNLYWVLGAPTDDPDTLRQRAERARLTNELYGKVLSTTATEEEIQRYYAERRRVSEDYIEFAEMVLTAYRDRLPTEHVGLYELSIRLHSARLDEIPRDQEEALARLRAKQRR
jgi:hypothetical protein